MTSSAAASLPTSMKAVQISQPGSFEQLKLCQVQLPKILPHQVLIRTEYSGVNMIDNYGLSGLYKLPLPAILGHECSGKVVALGDQVKDLKVGDPVCAYTLGAGDHVLVHAAAGGVGLLLCQVASSLGAHVIGTVSNEEKAKLAKENGAEHVLIYDRENLEPVVEKVLQITGGQGCQGIFDGVGKDTWEADFKMIARKGTIVTFGNASGPVPEFAPLKLAAKNVKVCRPTLNNYVHTREEMDSYSEQLFQLLAGREEAKLKVHLHKVYQFGEEGVRSALRDIKSRETMGKLVVKID
ncbi:hypothetical protein IE53DRAFT_361457 [Violaceomyces palustris]|uniref:Uncharacterized protein n=1 Tax=Violaceomyces palustris TaxID=1673888 RepID=A0ACD0P0K0_9BASI|nr:hypothetical protein IE53DRAFT_361457 [Violaceomyces palustris]